MLAKKKSRLLTLVASWLTTVGLACSLFVVALLPEKSFEQYDGAVDVLIKDGGHAFGFFLITVSLYISIYLSGARRGTLRFTTLVIFWCIFASEAAQESYGPGREFSGRDVILDTLGMYCAILLGYWVQSQWESVYERVINTLAFLIISLIAMALFISVVGTYITAREHVDIFIPTIIGVYGCIMLALVLAIPLAFIEPAPKVKNPDSTYQHRSTR